MLEFSDGSDYSLQMNAIDDVQRFVFPPVESSWVKIHILSNYQNGNSYDNALNNCGFSEVVLYEYKASCGNCYYLPSDYNSDCHVNFYDFKEFAQGRYSIEDLLFFASQWLFCNNSGDSSCFNSFGF
jgi:hypothetical protein